MERGKEVGNGGKEGEGMEGGSGEWWVGERGKEVVVRGGWEGGREEGG